MKFGTEIYHKLCRKFYTKYIIHFNNVNMAMTRIFEVIAYKFNVIGNYNSAKYVHKRLITW